MIYCHHYKQYIKWYIYVIKLLDYKKKPHQQTLELGRVRQKSKYLTLRASEKFCKSIFSVSCSSTIIE